MPAIIENFEDAIRALDSEPIIIGHSAGGAITQVLLDHGHGAAGVALNSAPTEGVRVVPPSQVKSTWPVLKNPANHHKAVGFTFEQWNYAFTNGFPADQARELYERYAIPASGRILFDSVTANFMPGPQDTAVDYKNDDRAPLAVRFRQRGPRRAAVDPAVQPEALQVRHRRHRYEGPHLMVALRRVGRRRAPTMTSPPRALQDRHWS